MTEDKKPTKKALLEAFRAEMGKCSAMIEEDKPCEHWGVDRVDGKAYCGQHINSVYLAADVAQRKAIEKAEWRRREDRYIAWRSEHPSVWDASPPGWYDQ